MRSKIWLSLIILLISVSSVFSQGVKILEIRGGYLDPKGTESGLILGTSFGFFFDERVDITLGVDYFHKTYRKETVVADTGYISGVEESTVMRELEYNTTILPITASANVRLPFHRFTYWYAGVGLSYQFLFNTEHNLRQDIQEKRNYKGFGWIVRAGIEYNVGSRSSVFAELFYNNCKAKGNEEKIEGLPVWDEVDISGLGFRGGIRLEFY